MREDNNKRISDETPAQREARLVKIKENTNKRISEETPKQRLIRLKKKRENMKNFRSKVNREGTSLKRLKIFRDRICWGPSFPCVTCNQTMFRHQVSILDNNNSAF